MDYIYNRETENEQTRVIFLCELDTVFGFSYFGWTPTMYRLKILYNDDISPEKSDKKRFICPSNPDIIYTMSYLMGSFKGGQLTGTWKPPSPNSKNALLLWTEAITFFYEQVKKYDPAFLTEKIDIITKEKNAIR